MGTLPKQVTLADRLGSALFLAALAHGVVILGVNFAANPSGDTEALPSLNVTLLADGTDPDAEPDRSDLYAQRNQRGSGAASAHERPTASLAADESPNLAGDPLGADASEGARTDTPSRELLTARNADERAQTLPSAAQPAPAIMKTASSTDRPSPETLITEVDSAVELAGAGDRELLATPSTRKSIVAAYLNDWRRRVERIGTANFPAEFLGDGSHRRPTLEVVIDTDGRLKDVVVRRSSGSAALDEAAVSILRSAAPFEPLPTDVRTEYDVLRFAYDWDFFGGNRGRVRAGELAVAN